MKAKIAALSSAGLLAMGALLSASPAAAQLNINPVFGTQFNLCGAGATTCAGLTVAKITPLAGTAAAGAITAAANQISSQFTNPVTANIVFYGYHGGTNSFLGASISGQSVYSYSDFVGALAADSAAHPTNSVLASAVANLGSGNGAANLPGANVVVNTTDARVLGLGAGVNTLFGTGDATPQFLTDGSFTGGNGTVDGLVFLNIDQPLFYTRPIPDVSSQFGYDAQDTMEHEINEVMGIGGAGGQLNNFAADANYAHDFYGVSGPLIGELDLFRYQAPGVASFDPHTLELTGCGPGQAFTKVAGHACSGANSPYFSVDGGVTNIDDFNQTFMFASGDASDWGIDLSHPCPGGVGHGGSGDVQDAFNCNNRSSDVTAGTPSWKAFEAIGYNGAAVPEPTMWALLISGFAFAGQVLRRQRRAFAA